MAFDEPSAQLHLELRRAVEAALATQRPILHHLNADTSWLLQIPRPCRAIRHDSRVYFNILIDPWFTGGQSDVASWFSQQFHATPAAVQNVADLVELVREVELLASGLGRDAGREPNVTLAHEALIDAVAVSHEFTDHCHRQTLLEIHPDVPVFAAHAAAKLIRSWKHFRTVVPISDVGDEQLDWRSTSLPPLPDWIGMSRLAEANHLLKYHAALVIAFNSQGSCASTANSAPRRQDTFTRKLTQCTAKPLQDPESAETIIYAPHGVSVAELSLLRSASPTLQPLAFLHGMHNLRVGMPDGRTVMQSNLGGHNGLRAQRSLKATYWIGTHDEVKEAHGLVAWFLQRQVVSLQEAVDVESRSLLSGEKAGETVRNGDERINSLDETNWLELGNGESRILI